ncbi:hypothetical protein G7046_g9163 [Stylonectria norvegica]|nr:hypothetical protein G7046_g9163 [Stylonectria norvegica]
MLQRRRSVPSGPTSTPTTASQPQLPTPPITTNPPTLTTSSSHTSQAPVPASRLLAQADALAKMTFELNLRALGTKTDRLETDLRKLVNCTQDDKNFRQEHAQRLEDMMREIMAVKTHMAGLQSDCVDVKGGLERQQVQVSEVKEVAEGFRRDVGDIRQLVEGLVERLNSLPRGEDAQDSNTMQHVSPPGVETRAMLRAKRKAKPHPQDLPDPQTRIQETLNSTRRWNHDHKTTALPDGQFIANYLKQQSKRDPPMAGFLQRALLRRVRLRGGFAAGRSGSRPGSLEEFCEGVAWQDVIEVAEDALVRDERRTLRALG